MAWKHRVKKAHKQTAIRQAKAETDLWCSRYVRIKAACDLDPVQRLGRCFTCGAVKDVKNMDSGHYKSRGSGGSSGLYFDVRAIRLQCKRCNGFEQGRPAEFRDGLVAQYGEAIVEHLEILHKVRVYSPEGKHWSVTNGEFAYASEEVFESAMKRAPFNFYRLVRAVAVGDPFYEVRFGEGDIAQSRQLEFYGPDGVLRGWVILNARKEPLVKATTQYRYTFGPMKQFGNLRVPAWGVYGNGGTLYEMISLEGSNQPPDASLFQPPDEFGG